jgi:hypothetical protein
MKLFRMIKNNSGSLFGNRHRNTKTDIKETVDVYFLIRILEQHGYRYNIALSAPTYSDNSNHHCCCFGMYDVPKYDPWQHKGLNVYEKDFYVGTRKYRERSTLLYYRSMTNEEALEYIQRKDREITELLTEENKLQEENVCQ